MRNRILIIFLLLGLSLPFAAQKHSAVELSVGGGWSTLGYKVQAQQADLTGSNSGSWGVQAHVGYAFFFTPNVGLGVGANFSRYGAGASLSGTLQWQGVADTEGETYDHLTLIHSLSDKQEIYLVEMPLTLYFLYPLTDALSFNAEIGAKYAIPVLSKAFYHADIEHQGNYGIWGLNLYDIPEHGFYRESDFHNNYSVAAKNQISIFLKLGLDYEIGANVHLFGNIYGDYGLMNALKRGQSELGFQNDRAGMEGTHYFMASYDGITATNILSEKSHPIQVGLELGIRFVFPHKKSYPCKCMGYF